MKNSVIKALFVILSILSISHFSIAQEWKWAKSAGGTNEDKGNAIAVDAMGNSYVVGSFRGYTFFGTTLSVYSSDQYDEDMFLAKYNSSGLIEWAVRAGGFDYEAANAVAIDSGGFIYVAGNFSDTSFFGSDTLRSVGDYDVFVAKFSPSGNIIWARSGGGMGSDVATGIVVSGAKVAITGSFNTSASFDTLLLTGSSENVFVVNYDTSGHVLWAKGAGGSGTDVAFGIHSNSDGSLLVSGYFWGSFIIGTDTLNSTGNADAFLAKYNANGNPLWVKQVGGSGYQYAYKVETDLMGNAYFFGEFDVNATFDTTTLLANGGGHDMFLAKYNNLGELIWAKTIGGNNYEYARGLAADNFGNTFITGYFTNSTTIGTTTLISAGQYDLFVAGFDSMGNAIWAKRGGGTLHEYSQDIDVDAAGNAIIAGYFGYLYTSPNYVAPIGSFSITGQGKRDIFVAKIEKAFCQGPVITQHPTGADICKGASTQLWVNAIGTALSYQWKRNGTNVGTNSPILILKDVNIGDAGNYSVQVIGTCGTATSTSVLVTVNATPSPDWIWGRKASGTNSESIADINTDLYGNIYAVGTFTGSTIFGDSSRVSKGFTDVFVVKYDALGNFKWVQTIGGTNNDEGYGVTTDLLGNVYVTGGFRGTAYAGTKMLNSSGGMDVLVAKYDSVGNLKWAIGAGGPSNDYGKSLAVGKNNSLYLTGTFNDTALFGNTQLMAVNGDMLLLRIDSVGGILWAKRGGGSGNDAGMDIATDSAGNIFVAGLFLATAHFDTKILTSVGGQYASDAFLVKYNPLGNAIWARNNGSPSDDQAIGLDMDLAGNCYLTGTFKSTANFGTYVLNSFGGKDVFIAKYDTAGLVQWALSQGGLTDDYPTDLAVSEQGHLFVTGYGALCGTASFILKYDTLGNNTWQKFSSSSQFIAVDVDDLGLPYFGGSFNQTTTFGPDLLSASGLDDAFLAKLGDTPTQIREPFKAQKNLLVYPNPTNGLLTVNIGTHNTAKITFYGLRGEQILNTQIVSQQSFDLSQMPKGVYILQSVSGNDVATCKVVVE